MIAVRKFALEQDLLKVSQRRRHALHALAELDEVILDKLLAHAALRSHGSRCLAGACSAVTESCRLNCRQTEGGGQPWPRSFLFTVRLLERLRPAISQIGDALEDLNQERQRPMGRLRIYANHIAAVGVIAPIWGRFLSTYPEVHLELAVGEAPATFSTMMD
jgi:hypothetical protein